MRRIVAAEIVSLDGVVESADEWTPSYFTPEVGRLIGESMAASDALLLGRRTYEEFAAVWPGRGTEDPVGAYMNNTPKFVISSTLNSADWNNSTVLRGDFRSQVEQLKESGGANINITGSATLVRSLLAKGLLDQLDLIVYPVIRGHGTRLFPDGTSEVKLELAEIHRFETGLLWLTYEPATTS